MARARFFFAALALAAALPLGAAEEPEAVYLKFHRAILNGDVEEVLHYGAEAQRAEISAMPASQRGATLKMMAVLMPRAFVLRAKNINPDGKSARLQLTGAGKPLVGDKPETLYGTARMVMEGSQWKVAGVDWSNQDPGGAAQAAPAKPAAKAASAPPAAPPKSTPQSRSTLPVGAMDSAPERKFGTQKPACVYKPVMTAEDLEACR